MSANDFSTEPIRDKNQLLEMNLFVIASAPRGRVTSLPDAVAPGDSVSNGRRAPTGVLKRNAL